MSVAPLKNPSVDASAGFMAPAGGPRAAENLVLLAHDDSLIEALASVVPADCLKVVVNESALAQQLLSAPAGVVFIDAGMAHAPGAMTQLVQRLYQQLPDIVLVVAGDGAAQTELAPLVTDGTIYRFVHKPVSAQRVKLFIDAAWRKRDGSSASGLYPALSVSSLAPAPPTALPRDFPWPAALAGVLMLGIGLTWLALRPASHPAAPAPAATVTPGIARTSPPSVVGAAPIPTPAADLDRLATAAEQALLAGNLADAERLTDAARAVDPGHVRVRFLTTQLAREQSREAARRRATAQIQADAPAPAPATMTAPKPTATPTPAVAPAGVPAAASAPPAILTPVVAASPTTTSDSPVTHEAASSGPPSSTPPVSEARDPYSIAAVILEREYSPDPVFPEIAREEDLTGFVDLEFMVHADGTVSDVNVLKAQPKGVFEKAAVDAVSKWRYRPIERNGTAVDEHARLRLNFGYR